MAGSTQKTNRKKRMKKGNPIKVTMRQSKNTYGERRMERVTYIGQHFFHK